MSRTTVETDRLTVRPLDADTWDAFADLCERHNGVWGGCWCTWFHTVQSEKTHTAEGNRALKEQLVRGDNAHAALVFDGDEAVGWCQYGTPAELPNINHRKEYEATSPGPDARAWRRSPCVAPSTSSPGPAVASSRPTRRTPRARR
jgi:hypothetical protein